MKLPKGIIFLVLLLLLFVFQYCKKVNKSYLVGEWELVEIEPLEDEEIVWTFYADGRLERVREYPDGIIEDLGSSYTTKNNLFSSFIVISDMKELAGLPDKNGKHKIMKLTSSQMILQRVQGELEETPFLRNEFIKKQ